MLCMRLNSFQLLNSTRYLSYYSAKCLTINPFLCDSINSNKRNISSVTYPSWFMTISDSTPVAYAQKYVVFIHEMTGTSWWASIIISAVSLRLALTLPLTIYQHRNNAKIENLSIEFQPTVKEIQKEVAKNVKLQKWPPNKAQRVYKKAIKKYWNELIIRDNCHPAKSSIVVWIQLPMWICLSIAIRNLTLMLPPSNEAVIRFTELTNGGILWFTNLTEIDSLMCLPLLMCISNLLIIQVQTYARNKELTRKQALTTNIFRGLTIFMLPLSYFLPSGVTLYWTTSSIYGLSQNLILLSPRLRKWFGIPRTPYNHEKPYQYIIDKTKQTLKITKDTSSIVKPALTEENLNWAAFTENYNDGSNINNNVRSKFDQTPIASSIHQQKTQTLNSNQNLGEPSWDGENCPPKTTGLYPIILDCRKYLNCFKGRGFVQSCAPGTLFNSKSLECDFPSKVQCFNGNLPNSITQPNQNFQTNEQLPNQEYYVGNHDQLKNNRNQVDGSSIVENTYHDSSNILNDYGVQPEKSKPLYGSDFIVNGPIRNQESTRQFKNPDLSSNQNIQSVTKEQNKFSDKPVTTQQFNNNPIENSNYYNPNIPSNYPSSSNQYNSNFDKHTRINQPQNKVRFSKEFSNLSQNKYNTLNKENNNPTLVSPTSWMRNQLKGKHGSNQNINSYSQTNVPLGNQVFEGQISEPVSDYNLNTNSQQINSNSRYPSNFDGSHSYTNYNRQTPIENVPVINTGYPNSENTPLFALEQSQNPPLISHNIELNSNNKPDTDYKQPTSSQYPHSILYNKPINSNVFQNNEQLAGYPITYNSQTNSKPVDDRSNNQFQILIPNITESEQFLSPHFTSLKDTYNDRSANGRKYSNQNVDQPYVYDNAYTSRPEISTYPLQNKVSDIKCPNNYNGILPHPYDCSKFLSCANGRTFIMDCGPGTLFNPTISVCDHPYNVQCNRVIEIAATTEIYNPDLDLDVRANFSEDISNSDVVSQTELPDNRAVLETLPIENRQLKVLRNPTSIDLSDNHLPNTSIIHTPFKDVIKKVENNISVRIDLKPNSTQSIRLRGGPKHSEGFLQVQEKPFQWGVVCDEPNLWTIDKADIVCRQLGFKRGAEQTWQGLTVTTDNPTKLLRNIGVTKVSCNGQESVFHNCQLQNDKSCNVERDAVWIKCRTNSGSRCQPEEVSYEDKCYKLYIPTVDKQNKSIQDIGFSKVEALEHCQKRGGSLIDINSQKENDFVSEWLYRQQIDGPILTSGVGVSVLGNPIWIWEGTENPFVHRNWWPGWEFKKTSSPNIKSNRALCIVLHKSFPCPSNPNSTKLCDSEYYYWEAIDCGTKTDRLPYICERNIDDIGCINGAGSDYNGAANTTASGNKCLSWEDATVLAAMKYRVSEKTRKILLTKHNKCRNPDGTDLQPWCYVQSTVGMVRSEFCDIPTCSTAAKSFRASALNQQIKCDVGYFECQPNECINQAWVCDNQADCSNGIDEKNCTNPLDNFSKTPEVRLPSNEIEKWLHTTVHTCANRCIMSEGFVCRSFSHSEVDQTCILSDGLKNDSLFLEPHKEWTYYEANNADCFGKFICDNGNCIDKVQECDGHNDCGDRSDENKCNGTDKKMGYEIRLAGGNTTYEGRVEVKVLGEWGMICDDKFDVREADVVCRELGFPSSLAVKSNSYFGVPVNKTRFVLDDLECRGNEKSLYSCQFKEWGIHDCNAQESVGVICRVPGGKNCTNEEFECQSGECIPIRFLCDSYADCTDKSDEHPDRCNVSVTSPTTTKPTKTSATTKAPKKYIQKIAQKKNATRL